MRIKEIVAEWYYIKDANGSPQILFAEQDSNIRDYYYRIATQNIPQLLAGHFGNKSKLKRIIKGSVQDFINVHGNSITKQNYDSLVRRITANIRGIILKGGNNG